MKGLRGSLKLCTHGAETKACVVVGWEGVEYACEVGCMGVEQLSEYCK